jgi:hypothetical protein
VGDIASVCADIAIDTTRLINHYLTTSTVLDGCYEVFYYQWDASLILMAFTSSRQNPECYSALSLAVDNFTLLSPGSEASRRASKITSEWINNLSMRNSGEGTDEDISATSLDWAFPEGMDAEFSNFFESDMLRLDNGDFGMGLDDQGNGWSEIFGFFDGLSQM